MLLRRTQLENKKHITIGNTEPDYTGLTVTVNGMVHEMPPKEFYLLFKLLNNPNKIFTRLELPSMSIKSDPDLLQQIWINLIDNSMKYSEPRTTIRILGHNNADSITVSVQDEGIGIPAEKQEHIFDAFYQCEESHKKDGNGLGLSIVKRILELPNGNIACKSIEGSGTKMTVNIQKQPEER